MKQVIFHATILSSIITLCNTGINYILFWGIISLVLIVWCNKHLTIREMAKFSGYNIFYKYINRYSIMLMKKNLLILGLFVVISVLTGIVIKQQIKLTKAVNYIDSLERDFPQYIDTTASSDAYTEWYSDTII